MTHNPDLQCPDCKGSGTYSGFNLIPEDCQRCGGLGEIGPGAAKPGSLRQMAQDGDMAGYDETMELIKDYIRKGPPSDNEYDEHDELIDSWQTPLVPKLEVLDSIWIYDAGWYEAVVTDITANPNDSYAMTETIHAETPCDKFRIKKMMMSYNVTQGRWEFIKAGTPVY